MQIFKSLGIYVLCIAIIIVSLFINISDVSYSKETLATHSTGKVIVIDAGHGSPDGGAVGISGILEKDINLSVAKKLQCLFEKTGTYVILTRSDDNNIASNNNGKIRDIKRKDLKARKDYRDNSGADLFISIHMNKFPEEKYKGAQVFYSKLPAESKILGETIQSSLKENLDINNERIAKCSDNSIYILKDSKIPSVIVECGFLSNHEEEKLLKDNNYQDKIAWAIFLGVLKYFENL